MSGRFGEDRLLAGDPIAGSPAQELARLRGRLDRRINAVDREELGKGLAQLVLTVVELLRQLMERQALRRIEGGSLTPEQVERLGQTFKALAEQMEEVKLAFDLEDEDLNLNLGPLGDLM